MSGNRNHPVAAQCAGQEGPGRIKITIHSWMGMPMHRSACYHVDHPNHAKPNDTTRNNGSWDYVRGKIPKDDYALHDEECEKREKALIEAEAQSKRDAELFEKKKAEKEAGTKRPLPKILDPITS